MALTELKIKNLRPKIKSYRVADGGGLTDPSSYALMEP